MARNTNIAEQLFEVTEQPVYLENHHHRVAGYKAIIGKPNQNEEKVFSIVSENYKLVTNEQALEMGKQIHQRLFPDANANCFEVFNVIAPHTKSSCQIDIIDKNYTLNIWKQEVYVPFVRIHNSYNRSRALKFDIGFCRKLCDNGVIFEQDAISLKFAHTKQSISIEKMFNVDVEHLKKLERQFIAKTKQCSDIELPKKYFLPLAAKTLGRNFNLAEPDPKKLELTKERLDFFTAKISDYSNRYILDEGFGETAYAFFNVITDYSSNCEQLPKSAISGLQSACGLWVNQVGELVSKPGFTWKDEIEAYSFLLKG